MTFTRQYLAEAIQIVDALDSGVIEQVMTALVDLRNRAGRLIILGVGGGAGHAPHRANDFRNIAKIEAYSPSDNVSELTVRTNGQTTKAGTRCTPPGSRTVACALTT